jgi:ABC-type dipeptide/oligopeptide/nickel transport system permease subunit
MDTQDQRPEIASHEILAPATGVGSSLPETSKTLTTPEEPTPESSNPEQEKLPPTPFQESLGRLWHDKRAVISLGVIAFFVLLALIGPPIYQHIGEQMKSDLIGMIGPNTYHLPDQGQASQHDQGPSARYWLGTDDAGRDILARIMQGTFVSLSVALLVEGIDITLGVIIGVLAGYFGGWIDVFLARFTDLMFAFPQLLFAILISGILGPNTDLFFSQIPALGSEYARLVLVSMALAFTTWPLMARYVRGQTLQLKERQFIEAARTSGTSNVQIILHHIIPNIFSLVIIASTLNIANTIIGEAGLSLLGLGVKLPGASLGLMISEAVTNVNIDTNAWEVIVPTAILTIIVLAVSFIGDGLHDAFDPRSKD